MTGSYRVEWYPGTDNLLGVCHCGATHIANEPIEIWDWLLAHPDGHRTDTRMPQTPPRVSAVV
ncbi:hypothetical protein [Nocardia alni]|uniref:hypothetical protein n=1 Tax=Nocardia alni TaxID=2815723 RepID=UPI001C22407A|nr:hypothetical protein [Nocardia alni]